MKAQSSFHSRRRGHCPVTALWLGLSTISVLCVPSWGFAFPIGRLRQPFASSSSPRRTATITGSWALLVSDLRQQSKPELDKESSPKDPTSVDKMQKLKRLKDYMWVRETLEDLTAAEFACTFDGDEPEENSEERRSVVDYEKLLGQLSRRLRDLGCEGNMGEDAASISCELDDGVGMGSTVYTNEQRSALLTRILRTRQLLLDVMKGAGLPTATEDLFSISLPEIDMSEFKKDSRNDKEGSGSIGPKLYVRDDGTVDWDGALQDQAALRKFGTAVWARINGRDPESVDVDGEEDADGKGGTGHGVVKKAVTAKIAETAEIVSERQRLESLEKDLAKAESSHTALLASSLSAGQATANIKLAALNAKQRNKIQESAAELETLKEKVMFQTLNYELERIYTYLVGELGNPALNGYIPLQDRLNVAEFGLLESQVTSFNRQLELGESVDSDVLSVVMDQLTDFKRRLGIDYYVTGLTFDREAIQRWLGELIEKTKSGAAFYVKGVQLFWNDILFCFRLIGRAATGYTLKPREVRTLR